MYDPSAKNYKSVFRYTLSNCNHMTVQMINYGAAITSIKIPDGFGKIDDVALGFDNVEGF